MQNSTKDHCHQRRQPVSAWPIKITTDSEILCRKEVFLSNVNNKQNFVNLLAASLKTAGHVVKLCGDNADLPIVSSAITEVSGEV